MRTDMTLEEMVACLDICDQTIGCSNCGKAWWGEDYTEDITMFHADGCQLKGRQDVHDAWDGSEPKPQAFQLGNRTHEDTASDQSMAKE